MDQTRSKAVVTSAGHELLIIEDYSGDLGRLTWLVRDPNGKALFSGNDLGFNNPFGSPIEEIVKERAHSAARNCLGSRGGEFIEFPEWENIAAPLPGQSM